MSLTELYPRHIERRLSEALLDTPVVLLAGPRQAGKTTLVRKIARQQGLLYLTLDDEVTRLSAQQDPAGLVRGLRGAVIDEVQRAPQLLLAIKKAVDEDRRPGRFLLTGSANLMALPTVADSLAGRMETLLLLPLSQSEIERQDDNWLDQAFEGRWLQVRHTAVGPQLMERVLRGGYPDAVSRESARRRTIWTRQYVDALIQRDVRDVASLEKLDLLPRFLRALAYTSGQMCNYASLGAQVGLDGKTAARYLAVFEQMYLLNRVDVWARNRLNRVVKTPKLQFLDSGLLATLLDLKAESLARERSLFGPLLETFVYSELLKQASSANDDYQLLYYRDADQYEVDVVVENSAGRLIGIEVKAAASLNRHDLRGLRRLASLAGDAFSMGVLLYDGTETLPLGDNIWAVPLSSLWGTSSA